MNAETLVAEGEKAALAEVMALYIREMHAIIGMTGAPATYPHFDLYWTEPDSRWPFWLKADDTNAGFALIRRVAERCEIAEFFVTPPYRRRGIGLSSARQLIGRYPGRWRIAQRAANSPAIAFWHRVLDGFVTYDDMTTETDAIRREQHFTVK